MKKITLLAFALTACLCFSSVAFAQKKAVDKIIEEGTTNNQVMNYLDVLCNRFGGRLVGSDAYENAAEWIIHEFGKMGIEAHLEEAGEVPVGFNRGPWFGRMIGGDQAMDLHFCTPSYTSGTHGLQRGHVLIEPKTQQEFDNMKLALKGAWVLVGGTNSGWPIDHDAQADSLRKAIRDENLQIEAKNNEAHRSGSDAKPIPYREGSVLFYKEMVEAGVLGFIQSSAVPIRALYDRKMVNNPETNFDNLPNVCDIKLDEHQYAIIEQMVKERRNFWLEFDIRNHFKLGPIKYHNIVATIKGTEKPDETVIVSGHLDAFDSGTGGIDCGTGIGALLESARLVALSGAKPKRTIKFIAFAAEEFGLLGAQAYVKTHAKELDKISYVINRDGAPFPAVGISVPQAMFNDIQAVCEPVKRVHPDYPFEVKVAEPRKRPTTTGSEDGSVFALHGVPAYGLEEDDFKGYNFSYWEIWHTERDLYTKNIPEYQEHTSTVTALVALGIANLDKQLSREGMYTD